MAMTGTGLRDAVRAARQAVDPLPDNPTESDVEEYTDALELAFMTAVVTYIQTNAELVGNIAAGIPVENTSNVLIGETREGVGVLSDVSIS